MSALLLQALSALVGAVVVYVFGVRQLSIQLRNSFIEKQLANFYSPLVGYRRRIRAKSVVRERIQSAAEDSWQEYCKGLREQEDLDSAKSGHDAFFAPLRKIIEYDNQQLLEELLPLYRRMLDTFTDNYWLADPETREFYQPLLEFIEIWDRHVAESLPPSVLVRLKHRESNLEAFYAHIEAKLDELQLQVKDKSWMPWL